MPLTYRLETIHHAVTIATTLERSWFRGHSRAVGVLTPRIFRAMNFNLVMNSFRPELEMGTVEHFKRHAPGLSDVACPGADDHLGWLCLMQHHRAPTRLLDWSENLLIALYFAVSADVDQDGELWAVMPWELNAAAGAGRGIPLVAKSRDLQFLIEQPYWAGTSEQLAERLELKEPVTKAIGFEPIHSVRRIAAQRSVFTIHPPPTDGNRIHEYLTDPKHLVRYLVPAAAKARILHDLRALGLTEAAVFQDLEGLSRYFDEDHRIVAYGLPKPPICGGQVEPAAGSITGQHQTTLST